MPLRIDVAGLAGDGKTTIITLIAKALKDAGVPFEVTNDMDFGEHSAWQEKRLQSIIQTLKERKEVVTIAQRHMSHEPRGDLSDG